MQEVFGYHTQNLRRALCLVTAFLTLGAVQLMFYWRPEWWVWTSCIPCPLQEADTVLLRTTVRTFLLSISNVLIITERQILHILTQGRYEVDI